MITARFLPTRILTVSLLALLSLTACKGTETKAEYPDPQNERIYRYGSLTGGEGGFSVMGGPKKHEGEQTGIGVNAFLWRASLDTVSFMPLASADPFGGTILTDWYADPSSPNERTKVQVYITSRELRADAIKANVFRQVADGRGGWKDAPVAADSGKKLEDAILTRARQVRQNNLNQ